MTGGLTYQKDCQLLRAAAELLRLPQPVIATSLAFLHRFHLACPEDASTSEITPACLFLASKVEEAQVRINDLLNAFLYLQQPSNPHTVAAIFPGLTAAVGGGAPTSADATGERAAVSSGVQERQRAVGLTDADGASAGAVVADQQSRPPRSVPPAEGAADQLSAELLVGDEYYAAKDQLIHHEQVLLRWLGFEICVEHPYRYLLNFANVMRCSEPVVRLALSLVNDSLLHTNLSARRHPADVAAGALQLGVSLLGVQLHGGTADSVTSAGGPNPDTDWRRLVGLVPHEVEAAGHELLRAVSTSAAGACDDSSMDDAAARLT